MIREYSRSRRVADQIQRELAIIIQQELKDPRLGMVTVSGAEISRDLAFADIYVSFLGVDNQQEVDSNLKILDGAVGFLRSRLAKKIKLRLVPVLRFHYDSSLSQGAYMQELISKARAGDSDFQEQSGEQ